ncbi:MAG: hypothetical protein M3456_07200 [Actinomycetota bacterium]|nr:hypothetical protein [Actinomycetota bacterium]
MSPVRAFLLLLALLVLAGVVLLMTTRPERAEPIQMERSQGAGENGVTPERPESRPEERLTKAEAKKIFERLDQARIRAYRRRNLKRISGFLTSNSPIEKTVKEEIRRLRKDSVLDRTVFETRRLSVRRITRKTIELVQVVAIDPMFITDSGEDLTLSSAADKDTIKWKLRKDDGDWLIHKGLVIDRKRISPIQ